MNQMFDGLIAMLIAFGGLLTSAVPILTFFAIKAVIMLGPLFVVIVLLSHLPRPRESVL